MAREAFTARGVQRSYGIARAQVCQAIKDGDLKAYRLGDRRLLIMREDLEEWFLKSAVVPRPKAEARVREVLEHESSVR